MARQNIGTVKEEHQACRWPACSGTLQYPEVENCSCHISPPCEACASNPLTCDECGEEHG